MKINQHISSFFSDSLFRNASYLVANSIVGSVTGFLFWLIATRLYTAEEVGLATTVLAVVGFIALFSDLGFTITLIRFIPHSKAKNNLINTCFTVSGIVALFLSIFFIVGVNIFSPKLFFLQSNLFYSVVFVLYTFLVSSVALQDSVFIAFRRAKLSFVKMSVQSTLKIPIIFMVTTLGPFGIILSFFVAYLFATLLSLYSLIPKISSFYKPLPKIDHSIIKQITHFSISNFIARIFESIPSAILPLLITNILSPEKTAYYYMAWMVATIVYVIPISISKSLFAEGSHTDENFILQIQKSIKLTLQFLVPIIIIFIIFGDYILLLFGEEYSSSGLHLLWLLLLSGIPITFNNVFITMKRIEKDIKFVILINGIITTGTVLISYLTLETWGIIGIGIAWLFSQTIALIISLFIHFAKKANYDI